MRVQNPTLDGLSRQEFTDAMYAALASGLSETRNPSRSAMPAPPRLS